MKKYLVNAAAYPQKDFVVVASSPESAEDLVRGWCRINDQWWKALDPGDTKVHMVEEILEMGWGPDIVESTDHLLIYVTCGGYFCTLVILDGVILYRERAADASCNNTTFAARTVAANISKALDTPVREINFPKINFLITKATELANWDNILKEAMRRCQSTTSL